MRSRIPGALLLVGGVVLLWVSSAAQTGQPLDDALQAIFERNAFAPATVGPTAWLDGGRLIARRKNDGIVLKETATGKEHLAVTAQDLTPAGGEPIQVSGFSWDPEAKRALVFTNTRRVWRMNTRGDYWVFDTTDKSLRRLGAARPEASLMFAKFSPDGTRVAYVHANNIFVEDLRTQEIRPLTSDGNADVFNGTGDWVNEEEFLIRDDFRWSPDGNAIAYWQFEHVRSGPIHADQQH